ncbi:MAG TPA: glycosyltransferase family 4 protein, partial [Gemmatimonadales bacterium]
EIARRYPAGSLVVSTGSLPGAAAADALLPHPVDRVPVPSSRLRAVHGWVAWSRRAAVLARAVRPELVWCGNLKPAAYPALWIQRRYGIPHGIFLHGTELLLLRERLQGTPRKRIAGRVLLGSAAVLVAVSRWTATLCREVLARLGLDPERADVRTLPLGTDPVRFRPGISTDEVRARYGLPPGRWLLTVARLAAHKGIDTGIRVLASLRDEVPDLRYAVVGSGIQRERLERLALELGVADRVRFLSGVPDADLPALYNTADIYLGVSRPAELMIEGFGIALTEASACGLPVIGGSGGGIPDAVRDGETGILVDGAQPAQVMGAVRLLLRDAALARRLGAQGRRAVETFYNWDRVAADVVRIGTEVAERGARRGETPVPGTPGRLASPVRR